MLVVYCLILKLKSRSFFDSFPCYNYDFVTHNSVLQDTMPTRIQAIHIVNAIAPSMLRTFLNVITPMLKDKLAQRVTLFLQKKLSDWYIHSVTIFIYGWFFGRSTFTTVWSPFMTQSQQNIFHKHLAALTMQQWANWPVSKHTSLKYARVLACQLHSVLTDSTMDLLCGCSDLFNSRTWMKSDEDCRPNTTVSEYGVEGSFRKLAVD